MKTRQNLTIVLLIFLPGLIFAQDSSKKLKNVNFGYHLVAANLNFEIQTKERPRSESALRVGAGYWNFFGWAHGPEFLLNFVFLSGKGKNHFEIDYGVLLAWESGDSLIPWPILNLGYRYQDPKKSGVLFRTGIGTEWFGPYVGVGFSL